MRQSASLAAAALPFIGLTSIVGVETITANGFTQRPFAPDATRFIVQPFGRWCNATRFAGEIDTLDDVPSPAAALAR